MKRMMYNLSNHAPDAHAPFLIHHRVYTDRHVTLCRVGNYSNCNYGQPVCVSDGSDGKTLHLYGTREWSKLQLLFDSANDMITGQEKLNLVGTIIPCSVNQISTALQRLGLAKLLNCFGHKNIADGVLITKGSRKSCGNTELVRSHYCEHRIRYASCIVHAHSCDD
ncbi:MAG TPA: hypothetical protein VI431_16980 [Candidatus Acidoferrum sp.]